MNLLIIFILVTLELSLILAHIGKFCVLPVLSVSLLISSICGRYLRCKRLNLAHLLMVLIIASLFFFQPYEYIDGGWDPGNYINTGVHIARTSGIIYHDDTIKEAKGTIIKYPGLYIKDAKKGIVVPQFFHLYPVLIAIFYKLFGLKSVFFINPILALLSVILLGRRFGFLSSLLLSLNIIQIWNARFPTTEILGQFLLLSGFYFWMEYLENGNRSYAFWAGISFGEFLLTIVTSFLIIPLMIIYLFYRHNRQDIYFAIPFSCLLIHLILQLHFYSSIYLESVLMFFRRKEIYLGGLLFISFLFLFKVKPRTIAFGVPFLFIYAYFIRPRISNSIEALNLVELGNWLSFFGLLVATIGLTRIIWKEKDEGLLLFILTALVFAIFFIYDKRMFSRYPFALRRYIPIVIPGYCVCISYLCKKTGRLIGAILAILVIAIPFFRCRDIIGIRDQKGWLGFWTEFANYMDNNAVYISNRYRWARPLTDIFGKNVLTEKELLKEGVYYITDNEKPYSLNWDFLELYSKTYKGEYMEHSLTFPPRRRKQEINFRIYKVTELQELTEDEYMVDIGEEDIGLLSGFDKARKFSGIEGTARWTFGEASLVIPAGGRSLTIMAGGMPKKAGESIISLYINNKPIVENYRLDEQMKIYRFKIDPKEIGKRAILRIESNTWSPSRYGIKGYPDNIGILLDWVKIER